MNDLHGGHAGASGIGRAPSTIVSVNPVRTVAAERLFVRELSWIRDVRGFRCRLVTARCRCHAQLIDAIEAARQFHRGVFKRHAAAAVRPHGISASPSTLILLLTGGSDRDRAAGFCERIGHAMARAEPDGVRHSAAQACISGASPVTTTRSDLTSLPGNGRRALRASRDRRRHRPSLDIFDRPLKREFGPHAPAINAKGRVPTSAVASRRRLSRKALSASAPASG